MSVAKNFLIKSLSFPRRVGRRVHWEWRKHQTRVAVAQATLSTAMEKDGITLFFCPEAGIVPHFAALCVAGRTLQEAGHAVRFVQCFNGFCRCPFMDSQRLPSEPTTAQREQTCMKCLESSQDMLSRYGLKAVSLSDAHTNQITQDLAKAVGDARGTADLSAFTFDGQKFGRLSFMNVALSHKIYDSQGITHEVRAVWLKYIESALLAYLLTDKILSTLRVKSIAHYNDYPTSLGARLAAKKHSITALSISHAAHRNIDRRQLLFSPTVWSYRTVRFYQEWTRWRALPLTQAQVGEIGLDLVARFSSKGSHNYSPAKRFGSNDVRSRFGIRAEQKLITAFTSSNDELYAMSATNEGLGIAPIPMRLTFSSERQWLDALIAFAESRPDVHLIVRIHPREGANRRDSVRSQNLQLLKDSYGQKSFQRCHFIWPEDPTSSYDIADETDVALVAWSTIAGELCRLGVPVLSMSDGMGYFAVGDYVDWEETSEKYFQKLSQLLSSEVPSLEKIQLAFRGYHLFHLASGVSVAEIIPSSDHGGLPDFRPCASGPEIVKVFTQGADILDLNYATQESSVHEASEALEAEAIRAQLRALIHFFQTGVYEVSDRPFQVPSCPSRLVARLLPLCVPPRSAKAG